MTVSLSLDVAVRVEVDGEVWGLYAVTFNHGDESYVFRIHAKNYEHAREMVADIKATATPLEGEIVAFSDTHPDDAVIQELEMLTYRTIH
ncbi:hypothetical protein YN18_001232 [Salmonella enterica subsp. enterica]|nr:hypothetical protein [Salmonella enterica subsp. enterica]EDR2888295.1 hypothetical protein [Salmonella enterica subsp. enterica]EDR6140816.1 hypothetical protein [Salmonella enterica subsp. enterica]EDU9860138.1 hypothetical protein [Salmonella enterica subsp. enterica]EDV0530424.1 hypothetical protein [Salmonella enterica subsp. enterica]